MKKRFISRVLASLLAVLMLFSMMSVMSASAAWDQQRYTIYFDATGWNVNRLYLLIGVDYWSTPYSFAWVSDNLYCCTVDDYPGATEWSIVNASGSLSAEGTPVSARVSLMINYTPVKSEPILGSVIYNTNGQQKDMYANATGMVVYEDWKTGEYLTGPKGGIVTISGRNRTGSVVAKDDTDVTLATGVTTLEVLSTTEVKMYAYARPGFDFVGWYDAPQAAA